MASRPTRRRRARRSRAFGRVHEVVSGLAVVEAGETRTASVTTRVSFRSLDPATLDWYLATEEWRERAGGYAIQGRGAALVAGIEGDYLNVVGLPVTALLELLPGILHAALLSSRFAAPSRQRQARCRLAWTIASATLRR